MQGGSKTKKTPLSHRWSHDGIVMHLGIQVTSQPVWLLFVITDT